jgi:hypothetical protein
MRRLALTAAFALTAILAAGAASAQSISVGQTVRGTIASSDPMLEDESHYDCWIFTGPAGVYTADYRSEQFDAFIAVGPGRDCAAQTDFTNDDWGDGLDSHIEFQTDGGPWFIRANTLGAGEYGDYTLSLVAGGDPANMIDGMDEESSDEPFDLSWADALEDQPGGDQHLVNVLCSAVDTLDLIATIEGMTDEQVEARIAEGLPFMERAYASGAGFGFDEAQVEDQVADLAVALMFDAEFEGDFSGARQECMSMIG